MPQKKTTEQFITELNGRNLSYPPLDLIPGQTYQGTNHPLQFKCLYNHLTTLIPKNVLRGSGCETCARQNISNANRKTLSEFLVQLDQRNAQHPEQQITFIDTEYKGTSTKHKFKCSTGHEFSTIPKTILRGHGCPLCSNRIAKNTSMFISELNARNQNTIKSKIYLISDQQYKTRNDKIDVYCERGHTWTTYPKVLLTRKTGCAQCSFIDRRGTMEEFQVQLQILNNNRIDRKWVVVDPSQEYVSIHNALDASCLKDHTWKSTAKRILDGHGCPICYGNNRKTTEQFLKDMKKITREITLLPDQRYKNASYKLKFKCLKDHIWSARPYNILNGYGCPTCSANNNYSKKAIDWLNHIQLTQNIKLQHAQNGGEYKIPSTNFRVDGFCIETNTAYEFYGDYWHGNPIKFNPDHFNSITEKTYGELYYNTTIREEAIKSLGYNLVTIWESDWDHQVLNNVDVLERAKKLLVPWDEWTTIESNVYLHQKSKTVVAFHPYMNTLEQVGGKNKLLNLYKKYSDQNYNVLQFFEDEYMSDTDILASKIRHIVHTNVAPRIFARKCKVGIITAQEKNIFLNNHHIQGADNSQINIGAYYNDTLVAVMTFCNPRVAVGQKGSKLQQKEIYELSRFATDNNFHVVGIASKLLSYFKSNYKWTEIYSYADRRWSTGNLYYQLGFQLSITNGPDYFYIVDKQRKHRWNYRKDKLKEIFPDYNANITEYQNMLNHGIDRVWGCGTLKFVLKR